MVINSDMIKNFLCEELGLSPEDANSNSLFGDGLLDSLNMIHLVSWLEKTAAVKFGVLDINMENLDSVERILKFISKKQS